jgi:hypothetical protein
LCDGLSRREFLRVGALGAGGLTLADLLRLKAQGQVEPRSSNKAVIMVFLQGGPSHLDTYDMKPDAPVEYRGEFQPIQTNVPGMQLCELMPRQAQIADKIAVIRNMRFTIVDGHCCVELVTGVGNRNARPRPSFGSVVSRLRGPREGMVPYVALDTDVSTNAAYLGPVYLGAAHRPFIPNGPDLQNLQLGAGMTRERLTRRQDTLRAFDGLRRDLDLQGDMAGMDAHTARAIDLVTSPRTRDAFDVSREPATVRSAYGRATGLLQARRLVEAGVSVVSLTLNPADLVGGNPRDGLLGQAWDTHNRNFESLRMFLPQFDQAVYALVNDLHARGLDQDVSVVFWGDLGRTPRVNQNAGRDHWPDAGLAMVIGGGLRMGQYIGATDARAERPLNGRAYMPRNVLATLYHALGINPHTTTLPDASGRPQYLVDDSDMVSELV